MISISGVRGVIGEVLTPEVAARFAAAFGTMVGGGRVVLGRDSRKSGDFIRHAVVSGLVSTGCTGIDLGICPTPTLQIWAEEMNGGIVITASHNPLEWNGLKFIGGDGLFLDAEGAAKLIACYERNAIQYAAWDRLGESVCEENPFEKHIDRVMRLDSIDAIHLQRKKYKVVFDGCNASMSLLGPRFLRRLGCQVIELHCQPTGLFPRDPEPVPDHLGDLCSAVIDHGADVGFAVDPDGDRLSIVSNEGKALGEEYTLALAIQYMLSQKRGPVVINLSTSRMIEDIASAANVSVERTPVGEINVARRLREVNGSIGGEGNGGVILPEAHYGRDALVGMALVLGAMADREAAVSDLASKIPAYCMIKRKYQPENVELDSVMTAIADHYAASSPDRTDGVRLSWSDRWIHIRKSNTEPMIRVIAEAPTRRETEELVEGTIETIESLIHSCKSGTGKRR